MDTRGYWNFSQGILFCGVVVNIMCLVSGWEHLERRGRKLSFVTVHIEGSEGGELLEIF